MDLYAIVINGLPHDIEQQVAVGILAEDGIFAGATVIDVVPGPRKILARWSTHGVVLSLIDRLLYVKWECLTPL
jgi:hypothetical protein